MKHFSPRRAAVAGLLGVCTAFLVAVPANAGIFTGSSGNNPVIDISPAPPGISVDRPGTEVQLVPDGSGGRVWVTPEGAGNQRPVEVWITPAQ